MFLLENQISLDHGANRLELQMQGLADVILFLPYTIGDYLSPDIKWDLYLPIT
jgi:hypothetical protein